MSLITLNRRKRDNSKVRLQIERPPGPSPKRKAFSPPTVSEKQASPAASRSLGIWGVFALSFSSPGTQLILFLGVLSFVVGAMVIQRWISRMKRTHFIDTKTWPFRFPVLLAVQNVFMYYTRWIRRDDVFKGHPRPPRIRYHSMALLGLRHILNPAKLFTAIQKHYGDTSFFELPTGHRVFIVSHPDASRDILKSTDDKDGSALRSEMQQGSSGRLNGRGNSFVTTGQRWRFLRRILQPYFGPKAVYRPSTLSKVQEIIDANLDDLADRIHENQGPIDVEILEETQAITEGVILEHLLGLGLPREDIISEFLPAVATVLRWVSLETLNPSHIRIGDLPAFLPFHRRLKDAYATVDRYGERILDMHRAGETRPINFLRDMIASGKFNDRELKNEILLMITAGSETTAIMISWALYLLAKNPKILSKLRREIKSQRKKGPLTVDQINSGLPYLDNVLSETMRLYPSIFALPRFIPEDTVFKTRDGDIFIPAKSHVILPFHETHRRPQQWGEKQTGYPADGFHPSRFSPSNARDRSLSKQDLEIFPFGFGPHICLGMHLAYLEAKLTLIAFLERFEITLINPEEDLDIDSNLILKPQGGFAALVNFRHEDKEK